MSNIVMYRDANAAVRNAATINKQTDIKRFGGCVSRSEFRRRTEFIERRIALGYSRGEVAFLMGRYPGLVRGYEEMAWGIRPEGADIPVLSEIFGEDVSPLFPPQCEDALTWEVSGSRWVKGGFTHYEIVLETDAEPKPKFQAKEKLCSTYTDKDERDEMLASITLQQMLYGTYFLSSKSALEILSSLHRGLVPQIRPLILKHVIHGLIISGQLCCFRNGAGQLRYHKRMN